MEKALNARPAKKKEAYDEYGTHGNGLRGERNASQIEKEKTKEIWLSHYTQRKLNKANFKL